MTDEDWARLAPLMPRTGAKGGRPWADHRLIVEGIVWRYRTGCPWRDLPAEFGPWQTVWARHRTWSEDGTWDRIHAMRCCQMVCVSGPSTGRNHDECCDRYDESFEQAVCCRATCFAG
ncbi:transposase [Propioniciclava sp. MC1683]|nr:transposase [Propioniciclava sp. MC1683]